MAGGMEETAYILRRLAACPLFSGFSIDEVRELLPVLLPEVALHRRGDRIISCGAPARTGLVLEGMITASQEIYGETVHIVEMLEGGDLFCIDAAFSGEGTSPTDLTAECDCRVLFFDLARLFQDGDAESRERLWGNVGRLLADRCIRLLYKTEVLSAKLLRNQIMTFFHLMQRKHGTDSFKIRMSRQQLAQYLCVNRSALSRELNRMQRDGLIQLGRDRRVTIVNNRQGPADAPAQTGAKREYRTDTKTVG